MAYVYEAEFLEAFQAKIFDNYPKRFLGNKITNSFVL